MIVSVMDDPANLEWSAAAQIPYRWFPPIGRTPPTRAQVEAFQQFVEAENHAGSEIAGHGSSDRRRPGTFLAAYLIFQRAYDNRILKVGGSTCAENSWRNTP